MIITWEPRKEGHTEWWFAWYPRYLERRRGGRARMIIWLRRVQRCWVMTDQGTYEWTYEPPTARGEHE